LTPNPSPPRGEGRRTTCGPYSDIVATLFTRSRQEILMDSVRLMTYNPGHFHAALVQKEMIPGVAPRVDVYAPLGADLSAHLLRLASFNDRATNPTSWEVEVHASNDALGRMLRERPGNVVVLSGRNRDKI